jgi:hypothetical protein
LITEWTSMVIAEDVIELKDIQPITDPACIAQVAFGWTATELCALVPQCQSRCRPMLPIFELLLPRAIAPTFVFLWIPPLGRIGVDVPMLAAMAAIINCEIWFLKSDGEDRLALSSSAPRVGTERTGRLNGAAKLTMRDALNVVP